MKVKCPECHKIYDLPPMPQVVLKVRNIMANPNLSFKDIAEVIETDQAIAARLLKIANSAILWHERHGGFNSAGLCCAGL